VSPRRSPLAAALGVLSVGLLAAAFVWAHHWGTLADTVVAAWALATLASLLLSAGVLRSQDVWVAHASRRLAKIGLAGGIVSIVALVVAGAVWAAGIDPTGACGGG
jgi:glutaminase